MEAATERRPATDLSVYNAWHKPGPKWKIACWTLVNAIFFNNKLAVGSFYKARLLRLFGARIGQGVVFKPSVNIKYPWFLEIGDNSWIGEYVWIDNLTWVRIGRNACLSQGAMMLTGNHDYRRPTFDLILGEISLGDGAWIGAKAVVCPGVTCGSHSVLAVSSVANKDLDAYCIYQGNPAVKIRERRIADRADGKR